MADDALSGLSDLPPDSQGFALGYPIPPLRGFGQDSPSRGIAAPSDLSRSWPRLAPLYAGCRELSIEEEEGFLAPAHASLGMTTSVARHAPIVMPSGAEASLFDLAGAARRANCALVEKMDNQDLPAARYVTRPPAPTVGDPLHYDARLQALCALYAERFGSA